MMENITGKAVTNTNFLVTRLYLVDELKKMVAEHSVIIEAPRRFGKTSVIKEFIRQENVLSEEDKEFNIIFLELEGEETVNHFCFKLFKELLNLYQIRKHAEMIGQILGEAWNALAVRIGKIGIPEFEIELREKTRELDFSQWKEKIDPLIFGLNSLKKKTVIVFDEFPDMLSNFRDKGISQDEYRDVVDLLTGWLRSLRQTPSSGCKYQFVFCGSINLRKTLEKIGASKRINDLESFVVPPLTSNEAKVLISSLSDKYNLLIDPEGSAFLVEKISNGSPYYGQILIKTLRDTNEKEFNVTIVRSLYEGMLRGGNHDLNHFHSRLEEHLVSLEREVASMILKHLCYGAYSELEMYQEIFCEKCGVEVFRNIIDRLIYEGYVIMDFKDNNKLRFVSPILRDWWANKSGVF